jgi:hypothetical protein
LATALFSCSRHPHLSLFFPHCAWLVLAVDPADPALPASCIWSLSLAGTFITDATLHHHHDFTSSRASPGPLLSRAFTDHWWRIHLADKVPSTRFLELRQASDRLFIRKAHFCDEATISKSQHKSQPLGAPPKVDSRLCGPSI